MSITALAKQKFGKPLAASALALSMAFAPMAANDATAADRSASATASTQTVKPTAWDLARTAQKYSKENDAVGMFVTIAPGSRFTPQQVGDAMVRKFAKDGITAKYTYSYASGGKSVVDFFVRGVPYTGYSLGKAKEGYELVSSTIRALQAEKLASNTLAYNND